jgi:hypothetical protein
MDEFDYAMEHAVSHHSQALKTLERILYYRLCQAFRVPGSPQITSNLAFLIDARDYHIISKDSTACSSASATFEPFSISTLKSKIIPMIKKTAMDNILDLGL